LTTGFVAHGSIPLGVGGLGEPYSLIPGAALEGHGIENPIAAPVPKENNEAALVASELENPSNAIDDPVEVPSLDNLGSIPQINDVKNIQSLITSRSIHSGSHTGGGQGQGGASNFGSSNSGIQGLRATFYYCKQTPDGLPTQYMLDNDGLINNILRPFSKSWNDSVFSNNFYQSKIQLHAPAIFIPFCNANTAPNAFGVGDKVKPCRWIAHYKALLQAPRDCKFRFWGLGDDVMLVRWNRNLVLDNGWTILSRPGTLSNFIYAQGKEICGSRASIKANLDPEFRASIWLNVKEGDLYPIEILISVVPGGFFGAWLMIELWDEKNQRSSGKMTLLKVNDSRLPKGVINDTGIPIDMTGGDLKWRAYYLDKTPPLVKDEEIIDL
jgi:hypothetical protein